jgi:ferredoxin--NADP+ reductase
MDIDEKLNAKATAETVLDVRWWTDRLLTFTTTRAPGYSFTAGQYARLGLRDEHGMVWRAYSMTSAPSSDSLEFYGILVPGGLFTTRLQQIKPGERLYVERQSYGFMTPDRFGDGRDLWMLGTGTGIGPYISMLRDPWVWTHFSNLILVHGVRHAEEFAYIGELDALAAGPPATDGVRARLQIVRATTRDPDAARGDVLRGRITALLEDGTLERQTGLAVTPEHARVMMCGNPEMIEDMRKLLHKRDMRPCRRLAPGQFVTENYW